MTTPQAGSRWTRIALALLLVACGDAGEADGGDAPRDGGRADGAARDGGRADDDAGSRGDAGEGGDAGAPGRLRLVVGSGRWGGGEGTLTVLDLAPDGSITPRSETPSGVLPSYMAVDSRRQRLYVGDEVDGALRAYAVDGAGGLSLLDERATVGNPVYVALHPRRDLLFLAHYGPGRVEAVSFDEAGALVGARDVASGAQSHSAVPSPDGDTLFVAAKADDRVTQLAVAEDGSLTVTRTYQTAEGAGPRHLAFDPAGERLYLVNELDSTLNVYAWDAATRQLTALQQGVPTLPDGFGGESTGADVHLTPDGAFLFASNRPRGAPGILTRCAVASDGTLEVLGHTETRGETPRTFAIDLSGTWLAVANQGSDAVVLFRVEAGGELAFARSLDVAARPFFVGFLPY